MSIISADSGTGGNWGIVSSIIGGFEYSFRFIGASTDYSLDEKLVHTTKIQPKKIAAEQIIEKIGEEAFKAMIEHVWDKRLFRRKLTITDSFAMIPFVFEWADTNEGSAYWSDVQRKLRDLNSELR